MSATLDQTKERLSKRSRKNWPGIKLGSFFIELLQLRSKYLRIDVPTQATETFNSRPFDQYLELCLGLAEPYSNRGERTAKHKEGVRRAVKSFQQRKADPLYSWQWDDLFPQSEAALMKSRRFRAE
jgi:hypothetical protein